MFFLLHFLCPTTQMPNASPGEDGEHRVTRLIRPMTGTTAADKRREGNTFPISLNLYRAVGSERQRLVLMQLPNDRHFNGKRLPMADCTAAAFGPNRRSTKQFSGS
jgi:hypothetical protein